MPYSLGGDPKPEVQPIGNTVDGGLESTELKRLLAAADWSRRKLLPFRENRLAFIQQYAGGQYSDDAAYDRVPINLLELMTDTYVQFLAAKNPAVLVNSIHEELKPASYELELALNHLVKEIDFAKTLKLLVKDAMFGWAVAKIGLGPGDDQTEPFGFRHDAGQPYMDRVDMDDWVHDMHATRWDQISFCGNRYRVPLWWVQESELFDHSQTKDLTASERVSYNEDGDEKLENMSRGIDVQMEETEDTIELWDFWLPRKGLVLTVAADTEGGASGGKQIRGVEWDGPETGLYKPLYFHSVPNNIMPLAPASLLYDLHDLANRLWRKLGRQAERQKTLLTVQRSSMDDGERILKGDDGDIIGIDNPKAAQEYTFGGVDERTLAFSLQVKDLFSYLAGNLDSLAGLSAQAETLGQEKLLASSNSRRIGAMQDVVTTFTWECVGDLGWYLWTDPLIEVPITKRLGDYEVPTAWSPESREGDFYDYNIDVEPFSTTHQSPAERLMTVQNVFQNFVIPFLPQLQEQGIIVDFEGLLKLVAKYTDMNELNEMIIFSQESPEEFKGPVGEDERAAKPSVTERTYTRRNIPGASTQGKQEALMSALLGGGVQPSQMNAVTRPTTAPGV